ncbi:hypothetical protein HG531_011974 [Fusarium graminearum]|nr:hypothetical protein HG531_011974 [Fusarium graminearum]
MSSLSNTQSTEKSLCCGLWHTIHWIDCLKIWIAQKAQTTQTKLSMPNINHVTRPIGNSAHLSVLTFQNKSDQCIAIDPVGALNDGKATQHPPAVANVLVFFGSTVEAAARDLSLAQPSTEFLFIHKIQTPDNRKRCDTVSLCIESTVDPSKTPTLADLFFPFAFGFQLVESIRHGEDLHSTYCRKHVGVVTWRCTKSAVFMLAGENEIDDVLSWEGIRPTKQVESI